MKAEDVGLQTAFQEPEWPYSEKTLICCIKHVADSNAHNSWKAVAKHEPGGFPLLQLGTCVGWRSEAVAV